MKNALIIGSTSGIAHETAKLLAESGYNLVLAARNQSRNESVYMDIKTHCPNAEANLIAFDAFDTSSYTGLIIEAAKIYGKLDLIMIAHGTLPIHDDIKNDIYRISEEFTVNALSVISLATSAAEYFEKVGSGTLIVISSVAGDRGRQSNYVYGAAKAAVTTFMQGLRNRLYHSGIKCITVKPGFVNTAMTAKLKKNFLFAEPETIAAGILKAVDNNKDVVYLPFFWKYIMMIIKNIPESIFKKLKL